jgi:hypothetical protein
MTAIQKRIIIEGLKFIRKGIDLIQELLDSLK